MTKDELELQSKIAPKMANVIEIHQQLKDIFRTFEFNNETNCVEVLLDEECTWNTMVDAKTNLTFYIVHKSLSTSNVLLMDYEWYHWEMPCNGYRFTKKQLLQYKSDFPNWKQAKYFIFTKAIKHFIAQKWDLIEKNDFYFDLGFILFKRIFNDFNIRIIPAFNYYHFEKYTINGKKNYLQGIFYRLRSRDFFTRFPAIELTNITEKNQETNYLYLPTIRLIKYMYHQMTLKYKKEFSQDTDVHITPNKYYIFDYLLFSVYHKYFLKENAIERCFDVIQEVLQRIIIKYDSFFLPNNVIAFWELEIDNEDLQYTIECLLDYISEYLTDEHKYKEISDDVKNFVEYMESLESETFKKH